LGPDSALGSREALAKIAGGYGGNGPRRITRHNEAEGSIMMDTIGQKLMGVSTER
jgi:hypothetical protein